MLKRFWVGYMNWPIVKNWGPHAYYTHGLACGKPGTPITDSNAGNPSPIPMQNKAILVVYMYGHRFGVSHIKGSMEIGGDCGSAGRHGRASCCMIIKVGV